MITIKERALFKKSFGSIQLVNCVKLSGSTNVTKQHLLWENDDNSKRLKDIIKKILLIHIALHNINNSNLYMYYTIDNNLFGSTYNLISLTKLILFHDMYTYVYMYNLK